MRLLRLSLCAVLVAAAVAARAQDDDLPLGEPLPAIATMGDPSPWLLAKVVSTVDPNHYGTAILFAAESDRYLFVTNAHVLPAGEAARSAIRLQSPLKNYRVAAPVLVGLSYGHDLAVLALPRAATDLGEGAALDALLAHVFHEPDATGRVMQIAMTGFPGYPTLQERIIPAQRTDFLDNDLREARGEQRFPARTWSYPVALERSAHCPPVFVERCYAAPIVSWGFSGGALMGLPLDVETWPRAKILGVVSHFEPLSDRTHVIPIGTALQVARQIVDAEGTAPVVVTDDARGLLRADAFGKVEVLEGALAGAVVRGVDGTVGGGHESVGGGHESVGGGHESVGGGGGSATLYSATSGNAAFLGEWSAILRGLAEPTRWREPGQAFGAALAKLKPLRGVLALLRYEPGIVDDAGERQLALGGTPLPSLAAFAAAYRAAPEATWSVAPRPSSLPRRLEMRADARRGHHTFAHLTRFKTPDAIGALAHAGQLTRNLTGFDLQQLGPLMIAHSEGHGLVDLMIGQGSEFFRGLLTRAALETNARGTTLRVATTTARDELVITFPAELAARGPGLHRYEGPVSIATTSRLWVADVRYAVDGYAVVTVQRTATGHELKVVLAHARQIDAAFTDVDLSMLTRDEIVLDGLYVPLE